MTFIWTDEKIEKMRALLATGEMSAALVGIEIGVSRCAIIGKARRLGIPLKTKSGELKDRHGSAEAPKGKRPRQPSKDRRPRKPQKVIEDGSRPDRPLIAFLDLKPMNCRYPFGKPGADDFGFCGAPRAPGSSYCEGHHALCHGSGTPSEQRATEGIRS